MTSESSSAVEGLYWYFCSLQSSMVLGANIASLFPSTGMVTGNLITALSLGFLV